MVVTLFLVSFGESPLYFFVSGKVRFFPVGKLFLLLCYKDGLRRPEVVGFPPYLVGMVSFFTSRAPSQHTLLSSFSSSGYPLLK